MLPSIAAKLFAAAIAVHPQQKPTVREMSAVVLPPIEKQTVPAMRAAAPTVVEDIEDDDPTLVIDRAALASYLDCCAHDDAGEEQ